MAEMLQTIKTIEEDKDTLKSKIDALCAELVQNNAENQVNLPVDLLRDLEQWIIDCSIYNQTFLENHEMLDRLCILCEDIKDNQSETARQKTMSQLEDVITQVQSHGNSFEPSRQRMKETIRQIEAKIQQYRGLVKQNRQSSMKKSQKKSPEKKRTTSYSPIKSFKKMPLENKYSSKEDSPGRNQTERSKKDSDVRVFDDADFNTMNQDLRLRLDICQDEKADLDKQLKLATLKLQKLEDVKTRYDALNDTYKQQKSRYLLLVEKVRIHCEQNCSNGASLIRVVNKLQQL